MNESVSLVVSGLGINVTAQGLAAVIAAVVIFTVLVFGIRRRF